MSSSGSNRGIAYVFRPDVVATLVEDGAVLLDLDSKYFYSANQGAWQVLMPFETGATFGQIREHCRLLGADEADLVAVDGICEQLLADTLIEPIEGDCPPLSVEGGDWTFPTFEKHREPLQKIMASAFDPSIPLAE